MKTPLKYVEQFLSWFCKDELLEEIIGDLHEYHSELLDKPAWIRSGLIWFHALHFLRPFALKRIAGHLALNTVALWRHHIIITKRSFMRYPGQFWINLIGLTCGLASFLILFLWVEDERNVDHFNQHDRHLFRVMTNYQLTEKIATLEYSSGRLAMGMKNEMKEVEDAVRVGNDYFIPKGVISNKDQFVEVSGLFAGENFFQVLTYPLVYGDPKSLLEDKYSVVISEELALKVFDGTEGVVGQTLHWESQYYDRDLVITGIYRNVPANATKQFDAVVNYELLIEADKYAEAWDGGYAETYLVLNEQTNLTDFNQKIAHYMDEKIGSDKMELFIQRYSDRYLYSDFKEGVLIGGRIETVRLISGIALFILLIACFNFINLSTAKASVRMKEIGIKKVIGISRPILAWQFLLESIILVLIGVGLALVIVYFMLPEFNSITHKDLSLGLGVIALMIPIGILTGFLSGLYPALVLSSFKPVIIFRDQLRSRMSSVFVRKILVTTQFILTILLIIGMIITHEQLNYLHTKDLSYDRQNVISFYAKGKEVNSQLFVAALEQIPGVIQAGNMAGTFLWGGDNNSGYSWNGDPTNTDYLFLSPKIGYNVIETLGLEIMEGRSFSPSHHDSEDQIILNESAVSFMGLKNPIGTKLKHGDQGTREIIGVVRDFQYGSLHQKIEPLIFRFRDWGRHYLLKLDSREVYETLKQIEEVYHSFNPHYQFTASFLEDDYRALYGSELTLARLSVYFVVISILISCLGIFGLAAFTTERRTKEIGLRKILGASSLSILRLLNADFIKMLFIATLFAIPIGIYLSQGWLGNFAYQIELQWWYFMGAVFSVTIVFWLTVGLQVWIVLNSNPVESLRNE